MVDVAVNHLITGLIVLAFVQALFLKRGIKTDRRTFWLYFGVGSLVAAAPYYVTLLFLPQLLGGG